MSAAGAFRRSCSFQILAFVALALPVMGVAKTVAAEQDTASTATAAALADWAGGSTITLDELKLHALEIGELLNRASARVDGLADEASGHSESRALLNAVRQELDLSRQWNRHLTSILLEVADARRELGVRERKAAAEIFELTSIAEEARLELVALWQSLRPGMPAPFGDYDLPLKPTPTTIRPSTPEGAKKERDPAAETPETSDKTISGARQVLDQLDAMQETATGDIEAVRAKIIDALSTLAPHRKEPIKSDVLKSGQVDDALSSKDITAWAASIASKLHYEGSDSAEPAADDSVGSIQIAVPGVEDMMIESEILSTAAVRIAPDRRAPPIATIMAGSQVLVTGKVIDQDWYRVEIEGGRLGYISGDLINHRPAPSKMEQGTKSS